MWAVREQLVSDVFDPAAAVKLAAAKLVVETIGEALETGFLPAAPRKDACRWCDYKVICGPHEEQRTRTKPRKQIEHLLKLREAP